MPFTVGQRYDARVTGARLTYSQGGTEGIEVDFHSDDAEASISRVLWLTEGNRENVYRALQAMGSDDPSRFNPSVDLDWLEGRECRITIAEEEYRGRVRQVVQWINPPRAEVPPEAMANAMRYFGHDPGSSPVHDEEVPF